MQNKLYISCYIHFIYSLSKMAERPTPLEIFHERFAGLKSYQIALVTTISAVFMPGANETQAVIWLNRGNKRTHDPLVPPKASQFSRFLATMTGGIFSAARNPFQSGLICEVLDEWNRDFLSRFLAMKRKNDQSPSFRKALDMFLYFVSITEMRENTTVNCFDDFITIKRLSFEFLMIQNPSGQMRLFQMIGKDYHLVVVRSNPVTFFVQMVKVMLTIEGMMTECVC